MQNIKNFSILFLVAICLAPSTVFADDVTTATFKYKADPAGVEETVVCSPESCTITRFSQGRDYPENALIISAFSEVKEVHTRHLELLGRMMVVWAGGNSDLNASYRFKGDMAELGLGSYMKKFAETPIKAYLAK